MTQTESETRWLVATDVDAIQSYLLQSVHLNTIAGASNLVISVDRQIDIEGKRLNAETIVASGGIGLAEFSDATSAATFCNAMKHWYRKESVSGHLSVSDPVLVDLSRPFGASADEAFRNLERQKRAGFQRGELVTIPQGRACESCGQELAMKHQPIGQLADREHRWLGSACLKKHIYRERNFWLSWLRESSREKSNCWKTVVPGKHVPHDFNKLAGDYDLGLVVADVDGTGTILQKQLINQNKQAWKDFSQGLAKLAKDALTHAINEIVPTKYLETLGDQYLPVLPLFCGGDDLVIACRGDLALPLASSLCRYFAAAEKPWCPGGQLGLSAAVVVSRPGFPFRIAHQIADELLRNAKREAKRKCWSQMGVGAIDYALITESMGDPESILADRLIQSDRHEMTLHLTGRPYKAADSGARSIGGLAQAVEILGSQGFPRSKLHELRQLSSRTSWMLPSDTRSKSHVTELREQIELRFQDWFARTSRQPELKEVIAQLDPLLDCPLGDASASLWMRGDDGTNAAGEFRTPLGDLADTARLFGDLTKQDDRDTNSSDLEETENAMSH